MSGILDSLKHSERIADRRTPAARLLRQEFPTAAQAASGLRRPHATLQKNQTDGNAPSLPEYVPNGQAVGLTTVTALKSAAGQQFAMKDSWISIFDEYVKSHPDEFIDSPPTSPAN
ncbi:MAG: hypothetical protein ACKV0T_25320 [Planctomycetales bacterium]